MELIALLVVLAAAVMAENFLFSRVAFQNLSYSCALSTEEAVEGDEIELVEVVENRGWLPAPWLKTEITASRWLDFAGSQSVVADKVRFVPSFFWVRGYRRVERRWKVRCLRRGIFGVERVMLVSADLFGNVTLSRPVEIHASVTVLPRPLTPPPAPPAARYLSGEDTVRRHVLEDPFLRAGVREYSDRDPMSRISWKATARTGKLMAFENECSARRSLAVVLNLQSRPFENGPVLETRRMEDAIRVCAALFEEAAREGVPLRFLCNGSCGGTGVHETLATQENWGGRVAHTLLRTLAALRLESTEDLGVYLSGLEIDAGEIVLVTCFLSDAVARFAREKQTQGSQVRVLLLGYAADFPVDAGCPVTEIHGEWTQEVGA